MFPLSLNKSPKKENNEKKNELLKKTSKILDNSFSTIDYQKEKDTVEKKNSIFSKKNASLNHLNPEKTKIHNYKDSQKNQKLSPNKIFSLFNSQNFKINNIIFQKKEEKIKKIEEEKEKLQSLKFLEINNKTYRKEKLLSLITQKKTKNKKSFTCKCRKSTCLRLYCACFQNGEGCSLSCGCSSCLNNPKFSKARDYVIKKTKEINPLAFRNKYKKIELQGGSIGNNELVNSRGCRSKKIKCDKNYCECFKMGIKCSNMCRRGICENDKFFFEKKIVQKVYENKSRKKDKLVINTESLGIFKDCGSFKMRGKLKSISYLPFLPEHKRV